MKTELTKEQSQHLIELGVPKEKASNDLIENIYQLDHNESRPKIFTFTDLLELLPKAIVLDYCLKISINPIESVAYYENYFDEFHSLTPELIDALYELLIWVIENKYLEL